MSIVYECRNAVSMKCVLGTVCVLIQVVLLIPS